MLNDKKIIDFNFLITQDLWTDSIDKTTIVIIKFGLIRNINYTYQALCLQYKLRILKMFLL